MEAELEAEVSVTDVEVTEQSSPRPAAVVAETTESRSYPRFPNASMKKHMSMK